MTEKLQPGKIVGELSARGFRFGIAVSRFNNFITDRLLSAALDALERAGAPLQPGPQGGPGRG